MFAFKISNPDLHQQIEPNTIIFTEAISLGLG
jgi:hypothetical protein